MKNIVGFLSKHGGWFVLIMFLGYLVLITLATWPISSFTEKNIETMGQLGDSFGFLTSVFTALALWVALRLLHQNSQDMELFKRQAILSYLVEKSKLQPNYSYSASGNAGDTRSLSMFDQLLAKKQLDMPDNVCSIRITIGKNDPVIVHSAPRLIVNFVDKAVLKGDNSRALFLNSDRGPVYVMNLDEVSNLSVEGTFDVYFIYNDATMLPTMSRLLISVSENKAHHIERVDTFYLEPDDDLRLVENYNGCEEFMMKYYKSVVVGV